MLSSASALLVALSLFTGDIALEPTSPQLATTPDAQVATCSPTAGSKVVYPLYRRDASKDEDPNATPCDRVIQRMCNEGGAGVCNFLNKQFLKQKKKFTDRDQKQCQDMLDDPKKFYEALDQLRKFANRP